MRAIHRGSMRAIATSTLPVPEQCLAERPSKVVLTDVSVRVLKAPASGQITVWDKISPLGVRVSSGGSKTFIVMIGSGSRHTIGKVGVVPLVEARIEAKKIIAQKTLGLVTRSPTPSISFERAVALFVEENYRDCKSRTKHEAKRLLESHFMPALRRKSLPDVSDTDIGNQLAKLGHVKSEQLHAFRAIRTMLRWCTKPPGRYIAHSPLEGYGEPSKDRKGTRVLSDQELVSVWHSCEGLFGSLVKLLILWGTRNGETGRLQHSWREGDLLTIPGEYTKNGRSHAIPLLPMAKAVLAEQPENAAFYFPDRWKGESHFNDGSWGKFKKKLDERSGVNCWQLRDLRRTFRSNMAKLKVRREICELLLNHVSGSNKNELDEIYDRYDYIDEKREALGRWEDYLSKLLAEKPTV